MLEAQAAAMGLGIGWKALGSGESMSAQHRANPLTRLQIFLTWLMDTNYSSLFSPLLCYHLISSSKEIPHGDFPTTVRVITSLLQEALLTLVILLSSKRHDSWFCESHVSIYQVISCRY